MTWISWYEAKSRIIRDAIWSYLTPPAYIFLNEAVRYGRERYQHRPSKAIGEVTS